MMKDPIPERLIVRYLSREATQEEQEALFEWVAADERHQQLFQEWVAAWDRKLPQDLSLAVGPALQKLNRRIDTHLEPAGNHKEPHASPWWKLAASLTLFIAAGLGLYFYTSRAPVAQEMTIAYITTQAAQGQQTVTLADGSVVTLNAQASLRYPQAFNGPTREVYLEGEAFFSVAKDAVHPFKIYTGNVTTQVLGTTFNIHSGPDCVTVSVATGKVQVGDGTQAHTLLPSDKLVYQVHERRAEKSNANLVADLAWMRRELAFTDVALNDVALELEKAYGIPVVFANASLRQCIITGHYSNQPLEKVLQAIAFSTGMGYTIDHNTVRLSGPGCR